VRRCKASWQRRGVLYRARLDIVEKAGGNYAYRNAKLSQHAMHRRSGRASSLV
jgi:hypothetical protein